MATQVEVECINSERRKENTLKPLELIEKLVGGRNGRQGEMEFDIG